MTPLLDWLRNPWLSQQPEWQGRLGALLDHFAVARGKRVGVLAFHVDRADHAAVAGDSTGTMISESVLPNAVR